MAMPAACAVRLGFGRLIGKQPFHIDCILLQNMEILGGKHGGAHFIVPAQAFSSRVFKAIRIRIIDEQCAGAEIMPRTMQ